MCGHGPRSLGSWASPRSGCRRPRNLSASRCATCAQAYPSLGPLALQPLAAFFRSCLPGFMCWPFLICCLTTSLRPTPSVGCLQGYMPGDLYNLDSEYGKEADLINCIRTLQGAGLKVIGDTVRRGRPGRKAGYKPVGQARLPAWLASWQFLT